MQYKQNSLKRALFAKGMIVKAATGILVAAILPLAGTSQVFAAGDASFSFSSGGSTTVGGTFTLTVYETSSSGDNTNGVQANVSYPTAQLQYVSMSAGAFTFGCMQGTPSGEAQMGCASTTSLSGRQTAVTVTFNVVGSGSGQVKMASGSDIVGAPSGASVWDGSLTSASYSFSAPASSGGSTGGSSSGGSTAKSSAPAASSHTSTPSSTPATTPSKPATSTPTTTPQTTTQQPSATQAATAALTITVTDSSGKPVKGAKVTVDSQYSALTDANGKASLSGLPVGNHKVSVTASGKTTTTTTLMLASNENKQVSLKLAANQSFTPIIYVVLGLLVLGGGAVALLKLRGGSSIHGPQAPVSGIVVGSGKISATPARPTPTVQPSTPQPVTPQVITSTQPPANPGSTDGNGTPPNVQ